MAQIRKTRQQKIQISQRKAERADQASQLEGAAVSVNNSAILAEEMAKPSLAIDSHIQATYIYTKQELRRIAWISLVCIGLLLIATLFLSEMPLVVELRQWIGLPHLSPL